MPSEVVVVAGRDSAMLAMFREILGEYGYDVIVVEELFRTVSEVETNDADIVFLELGEEWDTLDALARLAEGRSRKLYIFVLTDFEGRERAMEALRRGASFFFVKPVNFKIILEYLEQIEEERRKAEEEESSDGALSLARFKLDRLTVMRMAPEMPGVIILRDADGHVLVVEWSDNVAQRLIYYVALNPALNEVARQAAWFEYFLTDDSSYLPKIFDRIVNEQGEFPLLMKEAPEGSRYHGRSGAGDEPAPAGAGGAAGIVTNYSTKSSEKDIEAVREMLRDAPDDLHLLDWYGFLCYSTGKLDEAEKTYRRIVEELGSTRSEHHFYLGNVLFKKKDLKGAVQAWKKAMSLAPGSKVAEKCKMRLQAVLALLKKKRSGV